MIGSLHPNRALMPFSVTEGRTVSAVFLSIFTFLSVMPLTMASAISRRSPSQTITAVRLSPERALITISFCVEI